MQPAKAKKVHALARNGFRKESIAQDVGVTLAEVQEVLKAAQRPRCRKRKRKSDAVKDQTRRAIRDLASDGAEFGVIWASFGGIVPRVQAYAIWKRHYVSREG